MGDVGACVVVGLLFLSLFSLLSLLPPTSALQAGQPHVIAKTLYRKVQYKKLFVFNKYKSVPYTVYVCEPNWVSADGISCSVPLCKGKTTQQGACQETFPNSHIIYAGGKKQTASEGKCTYAEQCTCTKTGFYSGGNHCLMCSAIANCDTEKCTTATDQTCVLCEGVVQDRPGFRAYVPSADKRLCKQACSWEADSTRCYPGTCANELASQCSCSAGFTGKQCNIITARPTLKRNEVKLTAGDGRSVVAPPDINKGESAAQNDHWTNIVNPSSLFYKMEALYTPSLPSPYPAYITDAKIGVTAGKVTLTAKNTNDQMVGSTVTRQCSGVSRSAPERNILTCEGTLAQAAFASSLALPFQHGYRLDFSFQAENGGYVKVHNKRTGSTETHYYSGTSQTHSFKLFFDTVTPYHCTGTTACEAAMLSLTDVTMSSQQTLTWNGWKDDDARIGHYTYTIYDLHYVNTQLTHKSIVSSGTTTQSSVTVTMTSGGMYSAVLSAVDRAGNHKSCRRLFLFDASSTIVTYNSPSSPLRATTAAEVTSWRWQQTEGDVRVTWTGRYSNEFHHNNHLLAAVKAEHGVDTLYDDRGGKRSVSAIANALGIVRFSTAYSKDNKGGTTLSPPADNGFTTEPDLSGSKTIPASVKDGESLTFWVRAYDLRDKHVQEAVTVHVDSSPPVLQNLWLTKDHLLNISVHGLAELNKMTIEWEAHDPHSGLKEVKWRVYDNYSSTDVLHGIAAVTPQGNTQTLAQCQATYASYPRGPNCYCTGAVGCFHRHFQVTPALVHSGTNSQGGVFHDKNTATHDHDYFIEVTVYNHANLSTTLTTQITVDLSPPEVGAVHDGMSGSREVDYQSGRQLHAHWGGFFDRESGVKFYQVAFDPQCLDSSVFGHNTQDKRVKVTYNTFASWEAPGEGQYHVTVVAFNRAMEKSRAVCSDGVRVDSTPPALSGVYVSGARGPPAAFFNNTPLLNTGTGQSPAAAGPAFYLAPQHHLFMNWTGSDAESGIHDYEVGLATAPNKEVADISAFRSTHQRAFYREHHPALPQGQPFFILLVAVNRAGLRTVLPLGPVTLVRTPPSYSGKVTLTLASDALRVTWNNALFTDVKTSLLQFAVALEEETSGSIVHPHISPTSSSPCNSSTPPSCASFPLSSLHWGLHQRHVYRAKVKVTNIAGLDLQLTSDPYVHDTRLAARGRVFEVVPKGEEAILGVQSWEDTDYQLTSSTLRARWSGFDVIAHNVTYTLGLGTAPRADDVSPFVAVGSSTEHGFSGLQLQRDKTYYVTVVATTSAGNVTVTSDGVTVIQSDQSEPAIRVMDGPGCGSVSDNQTWVPNHHKDVVKVPCEDDVSYQLSTSGLWAHWNMTSQQRHRYPDVLYKVQINIAGTNAWSDVTNYTASASNDVIRAEGLSLQAGGLYRLAVRWCVSRACSLPVFTTGVYVITRPPLAGPLTVRHDVTSGNSTLRVVMGRWRDGDIRREGEAQASLLTYQWALTQRQTTAAATTTTTTTTLLTPWRSLPSLQSLNATHAQFQVTLAGQLSLKKCIRLAVRGTSRVGLVTVTGSDVEDCQAVDPAPIIPRLVIDAVGPALPDSPSLAQPISLGFTEGWKKGDRDYTPSPHLLSAVWPSLRHSNITWAVLASQGTDVTSHFRDPAAQPISDPCSSPLKVACGSVTKQKYINVHFGPKTSRPLLVNGRHYYVCIHAEAEEVTYEKWTEKLPDVSACSDGVTVDLTSPEPGTVWVDGLLNGLYQRSGKVLSVRWSGFTDIEELGQSAHHSAILSYQLAVGSVKGGEDVYKFHDVGLVNDVILHNLTMQDGHVYYVTIRARDHVGRTAVASAKGFVVDTTPPLVTSAHFRFPQPYVTSTSTFSLCWTDKFTDKESGIDHYMVTLGSRRGHHDIMKGQKVTEDCGTFHTDVTMHNGHSYYVTVTAVNGADDHTAATSSPLVVMTTPMAAGQVMDGPPTSPGQTGTDRDFVRSPEDVRAWWTGFSNPLSPVTSYTVRLGSCPGCGDVIPDLDIGLAQEVKWSHAPLRHEVRYYTTVTACNAVRDCSTLTSDGVMIDVTPPLKGAVWDGTGDEDSHYQAHRDFLGAQWRGFQDTGSGLHSFSWRAGTSPGGSDVMPQRHVGLVFSAFTTALSSPLPEGPTIYITVTAADAAGNKVEVVSKGLQVDSSVPQVVAAASLGSGQGSLDGSSVVSADLLPVTFTFTDPHSHLASLHLSLHSHLYGQFQSSPVQVPGPLTQYKFTALTLHDGSVYNVKVTACNLAGLCTTSVSADILHDNSPPSTGTLAIQTEHAADLRRQGEPWMKWSPGSVTVAWLGFHDQHSGIHSYRLALGTTPFASDLNTGRQTARVLEADSNSTNYQHGDEGFVQVHTVPTSTLTPGQFVYITLWAVNGVGLQSHPAMSKLQLVQGGSLMLVRRCSPFNCLAHCACSVQGATCGPATNCTQHTGATNPNSLLTVLDQADLSLLNATSPVTSAASYQASQSYLAATWWVTTSQGLQPIRFEVSAGRSDQTTPKGVFNSVTDRPWRDVGLANSSLIVLPKGVKLTPKLAYSTFVRAWYADGSYAIFKSAGITPIIYGPTPTPLLARAVKEHSSASGNKDVDFVTSKFVHLSWTDKFVTSSPINSFQVFIGSRPEAADIFTSSRLLGTANRLSVGEGAVKGVREGAVYYSTVAAEGSSGLVTWAVSDGFSLDSSPPQGGAVWDGTGVQDLDYQSSNATVSATWHGFYDVDSGVRRYLWCVATAPAPGLCDVIPVTDVGLMTSANAQIASPVAEGTTLYNKVYAEDASGRRSEVRVSDGVKVDVTGPEGVGMVYSGGQNLVTNPSFEADTAPNNNNNTCDSTPPSGWQTTEGSCVTLHRPAHTVSARGLQHVVLTGTLQQNVSGLQPGTLYRLSLRLAHPHTASANQRPVRGHVTLGEVVTPFALDPSLCAGVCDTEGDPVMLWHRFHYMATAHSPTLPLAISTSTPSPDQRLAVDDVTLEAVGREAGGGGRKEEGMRWSGLFLARWSMVQISWHFVDQGSPIVDYQWALGTSRGGVQLQSYVSVGRRQHAGIHGLALVHGTRLHVTVVARNAAGLTSVAHSRPLVVDMTPPEFSPLLDGLAGGDVDYQNSQVVSARWSVTDPESSVSTCQWAVGRVKGRGDVIPFRNVDPSVPGVFNVSTDVTSAISGLPLPLKLYVSVRCYNMAGLPARATTDGITIVANANSNEMTSLTLFPDGMTQYPVLESCRARGDQLRMRWGHFASQVPVVGFEVSTRSSQDSHVTRTPVLPFLLTSALLNLTSSPLTPRTPHTLTLRPIDLLGDVSTVNVTRTSHVMPAWPSVKANGKITSSVSGSDLTLAWPDLFQSDLDLSYEVTAGSVVGGGDIILWKLTAKPSVVVSLAQSKAKAFNVSVVVTAIDACGQFAHHAHAVFVQL